MKKPKRKKKPRVYKLRTPDWAKIQIDDGVKLKFKDWPKMTDTIEFKVIMPVGCYGVLFKFEAP